MVDFGIYTTYVLFGITILLILAFSVIQVVKHPEGAKSALIGIVGLVVLCAVSYALSSGSDVAGNPVYEKLNTSESLSRWVGTGLIMLYILGALSALSILYVEITRLFK